MRRIIAALGQLARRLALGEQLKAALERHDHAADELDAAVKEVLHR